MRPVEYAQILLGCLGEAISGGPDPIDAEYVCLRFGGDVSPSLGTSTDECCTGLAWVRVVGVARTGPETDDPSFNTCLHAGRRLTLEMGTARCIPYGTVQRPTSCEDWTAAALRMDADHAAMEAALCCFRDAVSVMPYAPYAIVVTEYQPAGPDGNCLTGTLQLTLDYSCRCGS